MEVSWDKFEQGLRNAKRAVDEFCQSVRDIAPPADPDLDTDLECWHEDTVME